MSRRTNDHAVVTGGSSGIGRAVVEHLLNRGLHVTSFDLAVAEQPADAYGRWQQHHVDVTDEPAVRRALATATDLAGPVNRLVTSHGIRGEFKPALDLDLDTYRRVVDVHLTGTLVVARNMVAALSERADGEPLSDSSIVTISSTTADRGWANQADYGSAKAAIAQLTQNLAVEWAPLGVRVNSVAPGFTLTPMVQQMIDQGYDTAPTFARTPLGRMATPDEMAAAIAFLLLDGSFCTGVCMPVDGGWTAVGK